MSFTTKMFYYPRLIKAKLQMKGWFEQLYHTKIVFKPRNTDICNSQ